MKNLDEVLAKDTTGIKVKSSRICPTERALYPKVFAISSTFVAKRWQWQPESETARWAERRWQVACMRAKWIQTPTKKSQMHR